MSWCFVRDGALADVPRLAELSAQLGYPIEQAVMATNLQVMAA
ncbi:hypothetical protein [Chitinivorax sp. B]|nr:hypothetical protein [Chitinivorax sp. B]